MRGIMLFLLKVAMCAGAGAAAAAAAGADCQTQCGNVSMPFPFGFGKECFRDGFNISCNRDKNGTFRPYLYNVEIINISLVPPQMHVYNPIGFACYDNTGIMDRNHSRSTYLKLAHTPYKFSDTRNKFTAIGCRTLAYIKSFPGYDGERYMSGCLSLCQDQQSVNASDGQQCNGMGCCQTSIPKGLDYYEVAFSIGFNHSYVSEFSPCSYAFLADDQYIFKYSDVIFDKVYTRNGGRVPIVLDWAIRDQTCKQATQNRPVDYACVSQHSDCIDSTNGPGYVCNCSVGYHGNPYIDAGCTDIDECEHPEEYSCYGNCRNTEGNFTCSCPSGTHGDFRTPGGCQRKWPLLGKIALVGLCILFIALALYLVYERAKLSRSKQRCFRQNGGLLLQEQINAHQGVRFKMFSVGEMERATNNFHEGRIKGRGGQGIVYEGILDDKRRVAIKKAVLTDEKKKKEFAKEMYILSLINHKNVIKILGCCLEVEVPMLVYEFISRGTLYQHIQDRNLIMSLGFRLKVAIEAASALAYLHSDASPSIVHGDVKSSNILLDDEHVAKISDFGASLLPFKNVDASGVPGTDGYLDPESIQTGILTEKSDVYSFAVVILELLTRKKAVYSDGPTRTRSSLAHTFIERGLADIVDDEIRNTIGGEQMAGFEEMLRECLKMRGEERPTMAKVVVWLRRMTEFNQNSSECNPGSIVTLHGGDQSSYHATYTTHFFSSEQLAEFQPTPISFWPPHRPSVQVYRGLRGPPGDALGRVCRRQRREPPPHSLRMQELEEAGDQGLPIRRQGLVGERGEAGDNAIPLDVIVQLEHGSVPAAGEEDAEAERGGDRREDGREVGLAAR